MAHSEEHGHGAAHGHEEHHPNYVKIYFILLALLGVSIAGPTVGIKAVTLITAFGIAVVKAYLVASNFMHLKIEKRYVSYILVGALALMGVFYAGTSGDIMNHRGRNWENVAANAEVRRAMAAAEAEKGNEAGEHDGQGAVHEEH